MFKKLSLRIKLTIITTVIMILISSLLTIISVFNANYGFRYLTAKSDDNYSNLIESDMLKEKQYDEVMKDSKGVPNIYAESDNENMNPSENIAMDNARYLFKLNAIKYMIIIISIGSIFIYVILGRVLKPVKKLSTQVGIINEHSLSERITGVTSGDEISELADSFNTMLDRLDKAFESQKRFSADVAHELKTPLTALKANLDILEMEENPTEKDYKRMLNIFRKQTERMIDLVSNLFILEAQRNYDFKDDVEIVLVIEDILNDLGRDIRAKNINVEFKKKNVSILGNRTMITHAISNIVQNAVKYNNDYGSIYISIDRTKNDCSIRIEDTGIGIPDDKAEHIFEAFYRVDKSRSRKVGGAGLGLAITKDIINKHGGKVEYFSSEDGGSIFEITLPMVNC